MFKEPPPGPLAMIMMATHSLTHVGQEIMGDPLETKIFFATGAVCFFLFHLYCYLLFVYLYSFCFVSICDLMFIFVFVRN